LEEDKRKLRESRVNFGRKKRRVVVLFGEKDEMKIRERS
jgi:hypothetical protein